MKPLASEKALSRGLFTAAYIRLIFLEGKLA
jgi:hypothetical protein